MKKTVLITAMMLLIMISYSQEINTMFSDDSKSNKTMGGYGGPLIEATQINQEWGLFVGGKGGVIINRRFAVGGIGMALVSDHSIVGGNLSEDNPTPLTLNYAAGGAFFEYIFKLDRPVHFSVPLNLMLGGVSVLENKSAIESSYIFVFVPDVSIALYFANFFIQAINISYRQVFGSSLEAIGNQDLSGINIGLIFKFGNF